VDHDRRRVVAKATGKLAPEDFFRYQQEVWADPEVRGYDELVDMSGVEAIASPTPENVRKLADLSVSMDPEGVPTKFAIVAPDDLAYGLGRMYGAVRELDERGSKEVRVFRTLQEAEEWLLPGRPRA
jgi:hypothetical protein